MNSTSTPAGSAAHPVEGQLRAPVVARALDLIGAEVDSVHRRGFDHPVARSQQTTASLRDDDGRRRLRLPIAGVRGPRAKLYEMQVAIISDIHGNRHAFEAVLADAEPPAPTRCGASATSSATARNPTPRRAGAPPRGDLPGGNHDMGVTGAIGLDEFSTGAGIAARWTRETIATRTWSSSRPCSRRRGGRHRAVPRQPARSRLGVRPSALLAELCFDTQPQRLALIGTRTSRCRSCAPKATSRPASRGATATRSTRSERRRVAAEPGLGRPAARRRPARRLDDARPRPRPAAGTAWSTTSLPLGGDPRRAPTRLAGRAPRGRSMIVRGPPTSSRWRWRERRAARRLRWRRHEGRHPGRSAGELKSQIEDIKQAVDDGRCSGRARSAAPGRHGHRRCGSVERTIVARCATGPTSCAQRRRRVRSRRRHADDRDDDDRDDADADQQDARRRPRPRSPRRRRRRRRSSHRRRRPAVTQRPCRRPPPPSRARHPAAADLARRRRDPGDVPDE